MDLLAPDYIPEARFIKPDGSEQIVQPEHTRLREGNVYYNRYEHKGHIKCMCCESPMRFQAGTVSKAGSAAKGDASKFAPVHKHDDDCILPLRRDPYPADKIDRTRGYRVNINTRGFSPEYSTLSGVYEISANGHITINDEDLRTRESYAVHGMDDLVRFLNKANPKRLEDTVFIFNNAKLTLKQLVIRSNDTDALADLANRALSRKRGEAPPFCLLQVTTTQFFTADKWTPAHKRPPAPIDRIHAGQVEGLKRYIKPGVWIDEHHNTGLTWGMREPGSYWLLGLARCKRWTGDYAVVDNLNIKITDSDQICAVNKENADIGIARKRDGSGGGAAGAPSLAP